MKKIIFIIPLLIFFATFIPFAIIWALNTLFPVMVIEYTWSTWLAVVILITTLGAGVNSRK